MKSLRVVTASDREICNHRLRRYTETSSSHRQCHQVIDEKISSDRIVVLSLRIMITMFEEVVIHRSC